MKIKKTLKNSLIYFLPFIILIYLMFCFNLIIKDLQYGHKSYNISKHKINWPKYELEIKLKKIENFFRNLINQKNEVGLRKVHLLIPEKTSNKLLENIPSSTKNYYPSKLFIDDKILDTELRYFTDNPVGWLFDQKSIRVKTKKKDIINKKRYFQFKPAQNSLLGEFVPFLISKHLNLLSVKKKLVELYVNGKSNGIYIESERLNESFLRRNKIMPINLYKGEQSNNAENKIGLEHQLFNNPGLWKKIAILNTLEKSDRSDLSFLFNKIRKSENSTTEMEKLLSNGNLELFAKQEIFQTINQTMIGNDTHNMRLAIDSWTGKIYQIPHDVWFTSKDLEEFTSEDLGDLKVDWANNHIFRVINQSSHYLDYKYYEMYKYLVSKKIINKVVSELNELKNNYLISKKKDIGQIQRKYYSDTDKPIEDVNYFENFIYSLEKRNKDLLNILESVPKGKWEDVQDGFVIEVSDRLPISNLVIKYTNELPDKIVLDSNYNNKIDDKDLIFYPNENDEFNINVSLYSNREAILLNNINIPKVVIENEKTKFIFFDNKKVKVKEIIFENKFTKKKYLLSEGKVTAKFAKSNNSIIKNFGNKELVNFQNDIYIEKDTIINNEAKIYPGTTFYLSENSSLIFKNKLTAVGEVDKPITFKFWNKDPAQNKKKYWGALGLHGNKTKGSILKYINIEQGSGDTVENINYFANLSVHDTSNVLLENVFMKNNQFFDDMMHIIYSKNIKVKDSFFLNANADAIDTDISNGVYFENIKIENSKNDGLDFMESEANIENSIILLSGDKGVSVGENSSIKINNTQIKDNEIGIASKDSSLAEINNSIFSNNKIHLNVYKKNWRYGSSGSIVAKNSKFNISNKNFLSDRTGKIIIDKSNFIKSIESSKNVIFK